MPDKNTLFVTDLDGTLLLPDQTLSEFTLRTVNSLVERGMLFTYATARSGESSGQVTAGLKTSAPKVLYNGAMIQSARAERADDGGREMFDSFSADGKRLVGELTAAGIYPIVYSVIDGAEKFSFVRDKLNDGIERFVATRTDSVRYRSVRSETGLYDGDVFYITCIDDEYKLRPFYEKYKNEYNCIFQRDLYSGDMWLEILHKSATKANALKKLKHLYNCRLVVFGDGKNDIDMFKIADERYAVENACDELKALATEVIPKNTEDSVAKKLLLLFQKTYFF